MFSGEYDGGNHRISGLSITTGADNYQGLFRSTGNGAIIKNIRLSGTVNLPGVVGVGALVGLAERPTTITNVHSSVDVSGSVMVGGLVGWLAESTIKRSSSTGRVTGTSSDIGGLVGRARSLYGSLEAEVSDSYATGAVIGGGDEGVGGLIGGIETASDDPYKVLVSNTYATGRVSGGFPKGLIGRVSGPKAEVIDSFWDTQSTGQATSAGGTGKTTAQMKSFSTFNDASWNITNGWPASTVWVICDGSTYPFLRDQYTSWPCSPSYPGVTGGSTATTATGTATPIGSGFDITDAKSVGWSSVTATVETSTGTLTADAGDSGATVGVASNTITISGSIADVEKVLNSQGSAFARLNQASAGSAKVTVTVNPSPSFTIGGSPTYFFSGNGHYYRLNTSFRNWSEVNSDAQGATVAGAPGYVGVVRDQAEDDFIRGTILPNVPAGTDTERQVWLGAERGTNDLPAGCGSGKAFTWVPGTNAPPGDTTEVVPKCSGVQSGWTPWYAGEPANGAQELRLAYFNIGGAWRWHDSLETSARSLQEFGSNTSYTAASTTARITATSAPLNTTEPSVSGTAGIDRTLTAGNGTWVGDPDTFTYNYRWQRCGTTGFSSSTFAATGDFPYGIVFDSKGNLYTANFWDDSVTKITPAGSASRFADTGGGPNAITIDANDNIYTANHRGDNVTKITPGGVSSTFGPTGHRPWGIALDSSGNVYTSNSQSSNVTKITPAGVATTAWAETGDSPAGIVVDSSGTVFVTNYNAASITRITSEGVSSTSWATTSPGPYGLVMDGAGNLYTSNIGSNNVTKVTAAGASSTLGTTGSQPWAIDLDAQGNVYTANAGSDTVSRITPGGVTTNFGNTGSTPRAVVIDAGGNAYTGNWGANNVTKITACEDISTATSSTYTAQAADYQKSLKVKVTASNGVSPDGVAYSAPTSQVAGIPPTNDTAPSISGTAKVRETLTALPGIWSGNPTPSLSYEWQRCDSDSDNGSCTGITGTNSSTYVIQPADVGKYMRVQVTASNEALPNGVAYSPAPYSGPVEATPSRTLYVNKYSPNQSSTPGCANPDFTEIGSADPSFGAVGAAVSGDTIFICGSSTAGSDPPTATTGPYVPNAVLGTKSLTFVGDGPRRTILDGQNDRTQFYANLYDSGQGNNSYLNLRAMTVKRGRDINSGGAVEAGCRDMEVTNVHFIDNKDIGFGEGGGAINASNSADCPNLADVNVTSSLFTGNVADRLIAYGQGGSDGGAILAYGTVTVTDSRFENNRAGATATSPRAPRGGAISARQGITVTDSRFSSNTATGPGAFGGAIESGGGASISRSSFLSNNATGTGASAGAVYIFGGPATSTISASTFSGNSATGTATQAGALRGEAAALSVTNSTFTGNSASAHPTLSSSDDVTLQSVTSSGNSGTAPNYVIRSGGTLSIGNSIIAETGETCVAVTRNNLGGNVIADTTADTGDCLPFVGGGGGPADRVAPSAIALQPLADNGGPTQTVALGPGSVAADSVTGARPATDQRGVNRPIQASGPASSGAYQSTTSPSPPVNTALPEVTGTARVGQTLSTSDGSWTGNPTSFTYQWQTCEPVPADTSPDLIADWGSFGTGNGQFSLPMGVAIDSAGNVYVADSQNNRIQKFDAIGNFLATWGTAGTGNGQFVEPSAIATDSARNVYVADTGNQRIQKFTSTGAYLGQWGSRGTGNGQFEDPFGVAADNSGNVYVTDAGNNRVQKFTSAGTYLSQWGGFGSGNGQLNDPTGIATNRSGNVYVADTLNSRIQKFSSSGSYLSQWGSNGTGNGQFRSPFGIATDPAGDVYVADGDNNRIQKFTSSGTYLTQWSTFQGATPGTFFLPTSVATNAAGDVYVTDTNNERVVGFDLFDCTSDVSATNQTYALTGADLGKYIRVYVTASNPDGSQTVFSNLTAKVETEPPPPPVTHELSVTRSGTGTGTVTSSPAGIDCGSDCTESYNQGTTVTLTAAPASGSTFTGWSGAECSGTGSCEVTMSEARSVTATFTADSPSPTPPPPPTPSGKPKLVIGFDGPKKIRAGQRFRLEMTVSNRAGQTDTAQRSNRSADPTTARNIVACIKLPKGAMLVGNRGKARLEGRQVCRTQATLAAGRSFTHGFQARTVRSASGPITFLANASGTNAEGATSTASSRDRVKVAPVKESKPKPPTG